MKKLFYLTLMNIMCICAYAQQDFSDISGRNIFPIVNTYYNNTGIAEFIAADAIDGNRFNPTIPHYYRAEKMWYFKDSTPTLYQTADFGIGGIKCWFVSFNYISRTYGFNLHWDSGANTHQFVFHPGNHHTLEGVDILYAFLWVWIDLDNKTGDLYLVDLTNTKVIAKLASNFKGMDNANLNVFANLNCEVSDMLVITNANTFLVYDELPSESSSVSSIKADGQKQGTYDLTGKKIETPQKGINIVNDKKYIVK